MVFWQGRGRHTKKEKPTKSMVRTCAKMRKSSGNGLPAYCLDYPVYIWFKFYKSFHAQILGTWFMHRLWEPDWGGGGGGRSPPPLSQIIRSEVMFVFQEICLSDWLAKFIHCHYLVQWCWKLQESRFDWHNFIRTGINHEILHNLVHVVIWTGITFQILEFDLLDQKDFSISDLQSDTVL